MRPALGCRSGEHLRHDEDGLPYVLQPPNSLMLGHTLEYFRIPRDILITVLGKSTYARAGSSMIATPLEPGWEGQLVLEIVNHTNSPLKVYPGLPHGMCTTHPEIINPDLLAFFEGDGVTGGTEGEGIGEMA